MTQGQITIHKTRAHAAIHAGCESFGEFLNQESSASSLEEVLSVISFLIGPVGVYVSNHGGSVACGTVACTVVVVCSVLRCAQLRLVLLKPAPPWPGQVVEAQPVVRTVGARV